MSVLFFYPKAKEKIKNGKEERKMCIRDRGYATVVAAARASLNMGNEAVVNTGYTWVTKKNLKTDEVQKIL